MQRHLVRLVHLPGRRLGMAAVIFTCLALGATLAWAAVHIRLESSVPAANEVLSVAPDRFELQFSGPVNEGLSALVLVTPSGDSVNVALRTSGDDRILVGDVPELADGQHRVLWSTVSADGHPVSGEFEFTFADASAADRSRQAAPGEEIAVGFPPVGTTLLAGLGLACLLAFAGLLWYAGASRLMAEPSVRVSLAILGWSALVLLLADLCLWILQVRIPGSGLSSLWPALKSRAGVVAEVRLIFLLGALWTVPSRGRAAAVLALAALLVGAAAGHAAVTSSWIAVPANAVHLGAAAIWLGGLLLLVVVPDAPSDGSDAWRFEAVAGAVSAAALLAVLLVAGSGILQSALFVGDLAAYIGTRYGRLVFLKWVGFAILLGLGAYHRFRIMPTLVIDGPGGELETDDPAEEAARGDPAGVGRMSFRPQSQCPGPSLRERADRVQDNCHQWSGSSARRYRPTLDAPCDEP